MSELAKLRIDLQAAIREGAAIRDADAATALVLTDEQTRLLYAAAWHYAHALKSALAVEEYDTDGQAWTRFVSDDAARTRDKQRQTLGEAADIMSGLNSVLAAEIRQVADGLTFHRRGIREVRVDQRGVFASALVDVWREIGGGSWGLGSYQDGKHRGPILSLGLALLEKVGAPAVNQQPHSLYDAIRAEWNDGGPLG